MFDSGAWRKSDRVIGLALGLLVVFEVFFLVSDLPDVVRYAAASVGAVALIGGVMELGPNRR